MTDTTKFLPGDRVRAKRDTYIASFLKGELATVIAPPKHLADQFAVRFDNENRFPEPAVLGCRRWIDGCYFERQPIETGCYVRVTIEPDQPPTRVMDLFSTIKGEDYAVLLHGGSVNVELLARVEEPATDAVYLPGDLIINHRGNVVTVKERPDDRKPWNGDFVYWVDPDGYAWANSSVSKIKPAPIEKGSWVRVIDTGHNFQVFEVFGKHALEKGRPAFVLSQLRAIEAPQLSADDTPDVSIDFGTGIVFRSSTPNERHAATLKQAQQLASALAERHFPGTFTVADDLATVLDQISNMTSGMTRDNGGDTHELAKFLLMSGIKWDRQDGDDTCKVAQRIITQQREAIDEAAKLFLTTPVATPYDPSNIQAWLKKHGSLPNPEFKRGDLVTWGAAAFKGRITGEIPTDPGAAVEVIILSVYEDRTTEANSYIGRFSNPTLASLRHIAK